MKQNKIIGLVVLTVVVSLFLIIPNQADANNILKNVITFTGTYPAGVDVFDVALPNTIANNSKAFSLITFNHATDNNPSNSNRSWKLITNTYSLYKTITINASEVDENITLYPHLLNITDTDLRDDAQANGEDIIFTNTLGTVQFAHEIEDYDGTTGALVAWIGVPDVSSSTDTTYRMWYSSPTASSSENPSGVWDSDFDMVLHLHDDFLDSTTNSNDGASTNTINAVGQIADGESWDGAGDRIEVLDDETLDNLSGWTISTWISRATSNEDDSGIVMKSGNDDPEWTNSYGIAQVAQTNEICTWADASQTEQICFTPAEVFNQTYLVATYNGTGITLYSNGTEITNGNVTATPTANTGDLLVGKGQAGGMGANNDFVWDGDLDEVRVSGVARSEEYITTTYCDQLGNLECSFDSVGAEVSGSTFDSSVIRIFGHSGTPADNDAVDFVGHVVEYTNNSEMFVQHLNFTFGASTAEGEKFNKFTTPVNTSSTMILGSGVSYDGVNSAYGTEEFGRWRIANNTDWGYSVTDTPATGDNNVFAQIVDWNVDTVLVQTGNATILDGGNKTIQITPPTVIQPNQTIFISSYDTDGSTSEQTNRLTHLAFLQENGDMIFNRDSANFNNVFEWQLIEFQDSDMFVIHNSTCTAFGTLPECDEVGSRMPAGDLTFNMPIPAVNTTSSFAISPLMSPFGYSMTRTEGGDAGRIDTSMVTMNLTTSTNILMTRGDSSTDTSIGFEVITWGDVLGGATVFNQEITDIVTAVDSSQDLTGNMTESDTAQILDDIDVTAIFVVNLNDNGTTSDVIHFNITKLFSDGVPIFDDPELDIIKTLSELAVVNDSVLTDVSTISDESILDTVVSTDLIILNITKQVSDTVEASDNVDITIILELLLGDTVSADDPSILFTITQPTPPPTGIPSGDGGAGIQTFERIVGLAISSEFFHVEPADVIPSDFIIQTFGRDDSGISIINIEAEQEFITWFEFSKVPDPLLFDTSVDSSRSAVDPARFKNTALDEFVLNIPKISCTDLDVFVTPVPCIDPILYNAEVTFTFQKGEAQFREKHIVVIDAQSTVIECDLICQIINYLTLNWWWLAGIVFMFIIMYVIGGAVKSRRIRTVRRINEKHFSSFEASGRTQVRTKFKKGKR